ETATYTARMRSDGDRSALRHEQWRVRSRLFRRLGRDVERISKSVRRHQCAGLVESLQTSQGLPLPQSRVADSSRKRFSGAGSWPPPLVEWLPLSRFVSPNSKDPESVGARFPIQESARILR